MKSKTVKNLCESFFFLEKKYKLLDYKIDDVFIWQYLRMHLYYRLAVQVGVLEEPHNKVVKTGWVSKLINYFTLVKYIIFNNPFLKKSKKYDNAIFEHERCGEVNGLNVDIYSQHIRDELLAQGESVAVLDRPQGFRHSKQDFKKHRHYLDYIYTLAKFRSKLVNVKFSKKDENLIDDLQKEIYESFGVNFNFKREFIWGIKRYKALMPLFTKLLKKIAVNKLYIVVSYGFYDVIAAAKSLGVEVIELQHGIVGEYHLGYNFNSIHFNREYLPDEFICWSDSWGNCINWSFNKITIKEYSYQKNNIDQYLSKRTKRDAITIISQGAIGHSIAQYVVDNFESKFSNYTKIYYKLHPSEFAIKDEYSALKEIPNLTVVCDEINLFELFALSHSVVGVFSTALFEAEAMGCNILLMPISGVENVIKHPTFKLLQ